jgi:TetR/AcrR family transcriptional regulator, lmrAB and yxaGH operons repressor
MASTREQIIHKTCELLESQGYHATGLNQIVAESGTPKGSLYYYFPDGKEGLTEEAIDYTGRIVDERIRYNLAEVADPGEAIERFLNTIADHVEASGFRLGGPITMVAMETVVSSERLSAACGRAYQQWQHAFAGKLVGSGMAEEEAERIALLVVSSIEGAVILSRTHRSTAPLREVGALLRRIIHLSLTGEPTDDTE